MIPDLSTYLYPSNKSLTWNIDWVSDLESVWSIIEKIKFANNAVKKDIFTLFGSDKILELKTISGKKNHDLYLLSSFNEASFRRILGLSLKEYNRDMLYQISGFLSNCNMGELKKGKAKYRFWRTSLTYCLECLKDGYHSILHQFALIYECPFHGTRLSDQCPKCSNDIPYELSDQYFTEPYICKCGYRFKNNGNIMNWATEWRKYTLNEIQDKRVLTWMKLLEIEQNKLKKIYLYRHIDFRCTPQTLDFFISTLDLKKSIINNQEIYRVCSHNNILHMKTPSLKNDIGEVDFDILSTFQYVGDPNNKIRDIIINDLVAARNHIILSLGKHFRKTILKEHKSCIHRYVNVSKQMDKPDTPVCPFAFAYVKWKKSLLNIDSYFDVDNKIYNPSSPSIFNLSLTTDSAFDPLFELVRNVQKEHPIDNPNQYCHLKWLITHLVGHVSYYYFYELLAHVSGLQTFSDLYEEPFILRGEIFAIRFPSNQSMPFEILWDQKRNFEYKHIKCPFPTQKAKRKKDNEVSHHPRKLGIERINQYNRIYLEKLKTF